MLAGPDTEPALQSTLDDGNGPGPLPSTSSIWAPSADAIQETTKGLLVRMLILDPNDRAGVKAGDVLGRRDGSRERRGLPARGRRAPHRACLPRARRVRVRVDLGAGIPLDRTTRMGHHGILPPDHPAGNRAAEVEARLVKRLVARDPRAFSTLVRAYERRIFALILRMIGNRAEAEDLAQEVFVQVFKSVSSFRGESKLSTWIYRIAINLCKNRSKYLKVRHAGEQDELEAVQEYVPLGQTRSANVAAVDRPDEMVAGKQVERIVKQAIHELEPTFRECLVLRDVEELSYEEIGAITGLPEGTVKSRIHRARAQLKEIVERMLGERIP